MKKSDYAFPCGGCICNHCANNLYSEDKTAGEAKIFCDAVSSADGTMGTRRIRICGGRNVKSLL